MNPCAASRVPTSALIISQGAALTSAGVGDAPPALGVLGHGLPGASMAVEGEGSDGEGDLTFVDAGESNTVC